MAGAFIICFLIFAVLFLVFAIRQLRKRWNSQYRTFDKLRMEGIKFWHQFKNGNQFIGLDDKKKLVVLINYVRQEAVVIKIPVQDIVSVDIIEGNVTVTKERPGFLGNRYVSGNKVVSVKLRINVGRPKRISYTFDFTTHFTSASKIKAQEWKELLSGLIVNNDPGFDHLFNINISDAAWMNTSSFKPTSDHNTGIADELIKLNKLYTEGVLTKDEFDQQKKKVLNP